ncbi:MAG: GAF domain-containing protein [Candidatus Glassbacteria bacterium]|nr:GAF domain-containing protein [Candidatus Glassbacteria bacterium]
MTENSQNKTQARKDELGILLKISRVIQSCTEPEETFSSVLELLEELVDFEFAALFIYDGELKKLRVVANKGLVVDLIQPVSFDMGNGLSAWVAKQKRPILLSDIHRGKTQDEAPVRSFLSIPLLLGEELIGVMNFGHTMPGTFNRHNLHVLSIAAGQLSVIIERTLYFSQLSETNCQLEEKNRQLKQAQAALVERERLAAIGEVAVTVNHEINNPLTVIIGNAEFLLHDLNGADAETLRKVETIVSESKRIARITRALRRVDRPVSEDYLPGGRKMLRIDLEQEPELTPGGLPRS